MARLWPEGMPVQAREGADGVPVAFYWLDGWHPVTLVAARWRVRLGWWTREVAREYVKVTTSDGLLCTLFRDGSSGCWRLARLYD
jgi:hypothetical protein